MNCPDRMELMAFMDGELDPARLEMVADHVPGCGRCSAFLDSQRLLEKSWRDSWRDPPDLRFEAMRKGLLSREPARRGVPGWLIGVAAGAVAVFLGVKVFVVPGSGVLEDTIRTETVQRARDTVMQDVPAVHEQTVEEEDVALLAVPSSEPGSVVIDETLSVAAGSGTAEEVPLERALSQDVQEQVECVVVTGESGLMQNGPDAPAGFASARTASEPGTVSDAAQPAPEQAAEAEEGITGGICAGSGGGGLSVSGTMASDDRYAAVPVLSPAYTMVCQGPGGAAVEPWDRLTLFVDSILSARGSLPGLILVDSLGYTVEQGVIPREFLGVTDPSRVPMTVRIILH